MKCVYCSSVETKVVDKRDHLEYNTTRRRRECLNCTKRFSTLETPENVAVVVEKKDGSKEPFDRLKLREGIVQACQKRVAEDKVELLVDKIESRIRRLKSKSVSSELIGREVLRILKSIDEVAYVRFASVYKNFHSIDSFKKELGLFEKR